MRPALDARTSYHRQQTSKAMKSMISSCPHCGRRGNFRKHRFDSPPYLVWVCHFCRGEWTADREAT